MEREGVRLEMFRDKESDRHTARHSSDKKKSRRASLSLQRTPPDLPSPLAELGLEAAVLEPVPLG